MQTFTRLFLNIFLRVTFKIFIGPPFGFRTQRFVVALLSPLMIGTWGTTSYWKSHRLKVTMPKKGKRKGAIYYIHGGGFVLGNPDTHRSITERLAVGSGLAVYSVKYRLAPQHKFSEALDDVVQGYNSLIDSGLKASKIVIAGDSAGGYLAIALADHLSKTSGKPAGLVVISPVVSKSLSTLSMKEKKHRDPMIRRGWLEQGVSQTGSSSLKGLEAMNLGGFPETLIHVGTEEVLLDDSVQLFEAMQGKGCEVELRRFEKLWHVFHLQSFYLKDARNAVREIADFAVMAIDR